MKEASAHTHTERERERERDTHTHTHTHRKTQRMDAAYLQGALGSVVAQGCADTIAAAPPDPIHHLSLWLLKYVANTKISDDFFKEKQRSLHQTQSKEQAEKQLEESRAEDAREEAEAICKLREVGDGDPYLLFDSCLKTVKRFTGRQGKSTVLIPFT